MKNQMRCSVVLIGFTVLMVCLPPAVGAQDKGFGLGLVFGEPSGVSGKYWLNAKNAIDGAVAWSFNNKGFFHVHADYLWHFPDVIKSDIRLPLYVGIGGRIRFSDPVDVGVRVPVGIAWLVDGAPLDVFLEVVPNLDLTPSTDFELNGGVGARYYF